MTKLLLPSDPSVLARPTTECGEPLIGLAGIPALCRHPLCAAVYLRSTLVDRLITAQSLLPRGLRLLVTDGHRAGPGRPPHPWPGCAEADSAAHNTGGAADLTAWTAGGPVLDPDPESRRLLWEALNAAGLVNPPGMWWHWSYGDTYWSYRSEAVARYGPLQ